MNEFIKEVYAEGLSDKDGNLITEDEKMCMNRMVCLMESIAFNLRCVGEELHCINYRLAGG